jgi:hypothetical protein
VRALARRAVAEVAPDELPFFAATSDAYFRDPHGALTGGRRPTETLGSGFDIVVALASPVALAVATSVYQALTDKAGEAVVRGGGRLARRLWARLRRRDAQAPPAPDPAIIRALTPDQRARLRRVAEERARALDLTEDKVQLLVSAIMDGLDGDEPTG